MSAAQTHLGTGWCCLFDCPYTPRDFNQGSAVKRALARDLDAGVSQLGS